MPAVVEPGSVDIAGHERHIFGNRHPDVAGHHQAVGGEAVNALRHSGIRQLQGQRLGQLEAHRGARLKREIGLLVNEI